MSAEAWDIDDMDAEEDPVGGVLAPALQARIRPRRVIRAGFASLGIGCVISGVGFGVFRATLPGPRDAIQDHIRQIPVASVVYQHQLSNAQQAEIARLTNPETLDPAAAFRVPAALETLGPVDKAVFDHLLLTAESDTERAYLYKDLVAGHEVADIVTFAQQIHGLSPPELIAALNPTAPSILLAPIQPSPLRELLPDSCVATEWQLLRALHDPSYALKLHSEGNFSGPAVHMEQAQIVEREGGNTSAHTPLPYNPVIGMSDRGQFEEFNALTPVTGVRYQMYAVNPSDANAAFDAVVRSVRAGALVPMDVGDTQERHEVLVLATNNDQILIHDPGYGDTGWISRDQFVSGTMDRFHEAGGDGAGGWPNAIRVMLPVSETAPGLARVTIIAPEVPGLLLWAGIALGAGFVGTIGDFCLQAAQCLLRRRQMSAPAVASAGEVTA